MKCPDCGSALAGAPLGPSGETNQSYRCLRCGGFWVNGWLVNNLRASDLERWPGINNDGSWMALTTDECPNDASKIEPYAGEQVPVGVVVKRCTKCGWWWFPANNLFKFKPAQEAKASYFKLWGNLANLSTVLLPIMAVVVLVVGTVASVRLIQDQQQPDISATETVSDLRVINVGGGEAVVTFKTKAGGPAYVEFRRAGDPNRMRVEVVPENGIGSVKVSGLVSGGSYRFVVEAGGVRSEEYPFSN